MSGDSIEILATIGQLDVGGFFNKMARITRDGGPWLTIYEKPLYFMMQVTQIKRGSHQI